MRTQTSLASVLYRATNPSLILVTTAVTAAATLTQGVTYEGVSKSFRTESIMK